ncbi:LLM class F420-dependent oxidoreductase [Nocardioides humi]|uniref:LLM class F420-dependent oxidoreductase n=1 Tax=Nocardioides humi TaxID=449461 RepID=A0ABN2ACU5_9ACTN|nr:LLM class F420-dependent oxidoreductase [Nocardioides humi]
MKVGVHVPQWGSEASRDGVLEIARRVESVGLDSVWVADHVVFPTETSSRYPYRADGVPFTAEDGFLEAFTTLACLAGATERVLLGTSVLVLPMREPLLTAKVIATLDVLSAGRVVLAVGAGWWREEFEALGQRFEGRGRRMDEQLEVMRGCWTSPVLAHDGPDYRFAELACTPLPVQSGGPPVLVGGMSEAALRRAARSGDGWHAVGGDVEALAAGRARLDELAAEYGKAPGAVQLSSSVGLSPDPERAVAKLVALRDAGVDHAIVNLPGSVEEQLARIEQLGGEVVPAAVAP